MVICYRRQSQCQSVLMIQFLFSSFKYSMKVYLLTNLFVLALYIFRFGPITLNLVQPRHFHRSANTKPGKWTVLYWCIRVIDFAFFYDFSIAFLEDFRHCARVSVLQSLVFCCLSFFELRLLIIPFGIVNFSYWIS